MCRVISQGEAAFRRQVGIAGILQPLPSGTQQAVEFAGIEGLGLDRVCAGQLFQAPVRGSARLDWVACRKSVSVPTSQSLGSSTTRWLKDWPAA